MALSSKRPHILVVDDDTRIRELLGKYLRDQHFLVSVAKDAKEAYQHLEYFSFDLLIVDVMLPGESGTELTAKLRQRYDVPVLMLSAMGETEDRITGLEHGADDYLAKPFEPRELLLRIHTILRRTRANLPDPTILTLGDMAVDTATGQLRRAGETLAYLTPSEVHLLSILCKHKGQTVSRETLVELSSGAISERAVDVQITRLRQKIEPDPKKPIYLHTVRGAGYVLHLR